MENFKIQKILNKSRAVKFLKFLPFVFLTLGFINYTFAFVSSSSNYRIQSDSVNIGGVFSTSANYRIEDTLGEISSGVSTSTSYGLKAGYQRMQEVYIAVSPSSDVVLSPSISGISGGISNGSAVWTVTTDSSAGYSLTIKASASPALQSALDSFADYTPSGAAPDYNWSVVSTDSELGFTPEGNDIVQQYKDNGVDVCNAGSNDTSDKCWYNFSVSAETIANSSSSNHPSGATTTVKFRAESGSSRVQINGSYTATITVTAIAL